MEHGYLSKHEGWSKNVYIDYINRDRYAVLLWNCLFVVYRVWNMSRLCAYLCVFISGADHYLVHWLSEPDLLLVLCLPGRERCSGQQRLHRVWKLRRCPVVGSGKNLCGCLPVSVLAVYARGGCVRNVVLFYCSRPGPQYLQYVIRPGPVCTRLICCMMKFEWLICRINLFRE